MTEDQHNGVTCRSLQLNFVYTFMLQGIDLSNAPAVWSESSAEGRPRFQSVTTIRSGRADVTEPDPIDPYLALNQPHVDCVRGPKAIRLRFVSGKEVSAHQCASIRIGEGGVGTAVYCLTVVDQRLTKEEIVALANLGHRKVGPEWAVANENVAPAKILESAAESEVFLFGEFIEDVSAARAAIAKGFKRKSWPWIEVDRGLVGPDHKAPMSTTELVSCHFEVPFPVIIVELDREVYASVFLAGDQAAKYVAGGIRGRGDAGRRLRLHRDLMTILCRSRETDFPDMGFAAAHIGAKDGTLPNMSSVSNGFLHLYVRSCLGVFGPLGLKQEPESWVPTADPARYLVPALVDTVRHLRGRWHALAVSTQWLDRVAAVLSRDSVALQEAIKALIDIRRGLAGSLRDVVTYRLSSGSLATVYAAGVGAFRIEELQRVIAERMTTLDRLVAAVLEQDALGATDKWMDDARRFVTGEGE